MGKTGKAHKTAAYFLNRKPERSRRAIGHGGILPIVPALESRKMLQVDGRHFITMLALDENPAGRRQAVIELTLDRDGNDTRPRDPLRDIIAPRLVDSDEGHIAGALIGEHPRLHFDIVLHAAMAIEMVGRNIDENTGIGLE